MARREEELNGPAEGMAPQPVDWAKMSERFERDRESGLPFGERDREQREAREQGQQPQGAQASPDSADARSLAQSTGVGGTAGRAGVPPGPLSSSSRLATVVPPEVRSCSGATGVGGARPVRGARVA